MADEQNGKGIWKVIGASSAGTLIEWYDFYIFGSLATTLAPAFFPKENPTAALLSTLATFATGFLVRPFGAVLFGRLGDIVGRKNTFLLTLVLMGAATFGIGLLPTYSQVGIAAPILLLLLRLLQGLALGGEYGGAATYVAEHSPTNRRGYYTSFIQTTATLGLFVSLGIILIVSTTLGKEQFESFGWRIPFLLSVILVIFSYLIRRKMQESPLFAAIKEEGQTSKNPLKESFGMPNNRRLVLLALFGATAGQGVVWYTGQFYALYYMQTVLNVEKNAASIVVAISLVLGTPLFVVFGGLSDRIGRKKIIVAGLLIASICYLPIYMAMHAVTDTSTFKRTNPGDLPLVKVTTDPKTSDLVTATTTTAKYDNGTTQVTIVTERKPADPTKKPPKPETKITLTPTPKLMGLLAFLVLIQVVFVTMVYGPIAAFLVELFPTKIRYTSLSVPYHIGNGVFGGLVPLIATALQASTGSPYAGLTYPIGIALITALIGGIYLRDHHNIDLDQVPDRD